jgi:hypothetical protein
VICLNRPWEADDLKWIWAIDVRDIGTTVGSVLVSRGR